MDRSRPLDICKIETCSFVKHKVNSENISTNKAIQDAADELDIPYSTIKRWIYPQAQENYNEKRREDSESCITCDTSENLFDNLEHLENVIVERKKEIIKEAVEKKKENRQANLDKKKEEYEDRVSGGCVPGNTSVVDIYNTDKKFRVVYADPPWKYDLEQTSPNLGGAIKHYNTMTIEELCELPINNITEKDTVLFLWVTSPKLNQCWDIIKSWGFEYKTSFVWDKVKHNMGHYNSVRHEFLLICGRGKSAPDIRKLYDSVQSIERSGIHSEKPIEFMNIIDELYVYGDRIELFARDSKKENWYSWGNEV